MAEAKKTTKTASSKKVSSKKASSKKASSKKVSAKKASSKKDNLFAVIETGGKQYQVRVGDVIQIEKIEGKGEGDKIEFESVLLVDDGKDTSIGTPYIKGAKVSGVVEIADRDKKVEVSKFKSKSRYHIRKGHRQPFLKVNITNIK